MHYAAFHRQNAFVQLALDNGQLVASTAQRAILTED